MACLKDGIKEEAILILARKPLTSFGKKGISKLPNNGMYQLLVNFTNIHLDLLRKEIFQPLHK